MIGRIPGRATLLALAALLAVAVLGVTAGAANAESEVVYSNLPESNPGNVVSEAFEATQTGQFGGLVQLGGTARRNGAVTVGLSSWGCEHGGWPGTPECTTAMGARFSLPVTLNIYEAGPSNEVGALLRSVTKTFNIPYRPSENDKKCTGEAHGAWYDGALHQCFHGKYTKITFAVGKFTWPAKAIVSVAFNTSDYGTSPQRPQPCNSEPNGGCPYDSLNVGLTEETGPSVGSDPAPAGVYHNSQTAGNYCDGGIGGTGVFRLDDGCWTGYQPLIRVKATI